MQLADWNGDRQFTIANPSLANRHSVNLQSPLTISIAILQSPIEN
jgi:hypothetical protein